MIADLTNSDLIQLAGILVTGGAIYGGIRADLKTMHQRVEESMRASTRAHERIDSIYEGRQKDGH